MNLTNTSRFTLDKDAAVYLRKNKKYWNDLENGIAKQNDYKLVYNGDKDFWKYMYWNFQKINELWKYYKDLDLFLKNIHWGTFYKDIDNTIISLLDKISEQSDKKINLSIINMTPLEMVIIGKVFEDYWIKNVVYNLNRQPAVNSATKTLEAFLYLVSYEKSSFLKERNAKFVEKIKLHKYNTNLLNQFIIFDENNSIDSYDFHWVDEYIKNQIWYKVPKNVYRLDKYPDKEFLLNKWIKNIYFFDNDSDFWKLSNYYKEYLKEEEVWVSLTELKYSIFNKYSKIGYFEDYLMDQNRLYLSYKKQIANKAKQTTKTYTPKTSYNTYTPSTTYKKNTTDSNDKKKILPFLFLYPALLIAFLATDLWGVSWGNTSSSGWSTYIGSIWSNWSIWSSTSVSTSKSSSIIKSFGWGWFSKWSSS